jgi:hypothetical protein
LHLYTNPDLNENGGNNFWQHCCECSQNTASAIMGGRNMQKLIRAYICSAGALLLALATALFLVNFQETPLDFVPARDLVFNLQLPTLFWILGGILGITALFCLFGDQTTLQLIHVLWLSISLMVYRLSLLFLGVNGGVKGWLGEMADAFGVSTSTMGALLAMAVWYLFIGSSITITFVWASERMKRANPSMKMVCAQCGGHIEFFLRNLGQQIPCPHCQKTITLRKPDFLKTTCFFCKEHIEFPAHAIGQKIRCPHCKMDITLLEQPA